MPDNKQLCKTCKVRHLPPTGKKWKLQKKLHQVESDNELLSDAAVAGQSSATQTAQGASGDGQLLQLEILQQLKKMTERLDHMEEQMASTPGSSTPKSPELSSDSFLQSIKPSKKQKKSKGQIVNDSSSDESDCPSLEVLKSQLLQKKVDKRLRELNQSSHGKGKEKFKSMRGAVLTCKLNTGFIGLMKQFWVGSHGNV